MKSVSLTALILATMLIGVGCEAEYQSRPSRTPIGASEDASAILTSRGSTEWKNDPFWKTDGSSTNPPELSVASVANLVKPSVVVIRTETALGSGFVVGQDLVATNLHVVRGQDSIKVQFANGSLRVVTSIAAYDPAWDLAILIVKTGQTKPLVLGNSEALRVGETVVAIGNPNGLALSVSDGIVSALRSDGSDNSGVVIQTTAPISPGSSGGPLVSSRGVVVGVTSASLVGGQALNFAVSSNTLRSLVAKAELRENITTVRFAELTRPKQPQPEPRPKTVVKVVPEEFPQTILGLWWGESIESGKRKLRCKEFSRKNAPGAVLLCDDGFLLFSLKTGLESVFWEVSKETYDRCQQDILRMVGPIGRGETKSHEEYWAITYVLRGVAIGTVSCDTTYGETYTRYSITFRREPK